MLKSQNNEKQQGESMLKTAVTLGIITFAVVFIMALTNSLVAPVIAGRLQDDKNASVINLFGEGISSEKLLGFEDIYSQFNAPVTEILTVKKDGANILSGYCVTVTPKGFGGKITMLVAVNPDGTIKDTAILSMSETAGIGTKINSEEWFQDQFKNKSIDYLPDENAIDVIAHATVSSKAFYNGITAALEAVKEVISGNSNAETYDYSNRSENSQNDANIESSENSENGENVENEKNEESEEAQE